MIIKKNLLYLSLFFALIFVPMKSIYVHGAKVDGGSGYSTSGNKKGQNESLKESAINMMEAIWRITNTNPNTNDEVNQPTVGNANNPTTATTLSPTLQPNITLPPSTNNKQTNCPLTGKLNISGSQYSHLNKYLPCDKPRMIVIHWSGGWSSAQATFDTLNMRDRSCQFAIDENTTIQMLDHYYSNLVERGWCAGGDSNVGSINFEITGVWFNTVLFERIQNPKRYNQLIIMTDKTVTLTCKFLQMYNIPKSAIYGHYQLQKGKSDPGDKYLQFFKDEVNKAC